MAAHRETAERLLDTAERLFGEYGYDGVGMRELAREAKANLGAVTYHFGSKKTLYIQTFMRRLRAHNAERLRLLGEAQALTPGQSLSIETILDCMVRPTYTMGLAHPTFHAMVARSLLLPPPFLHAVLHREFEPNMAVFVAALHRSLPHVPENTIRMRVGFSMGLLGPLIRRSLQMGRLRARRNAEVEDRVLEELVRFMAAGMQSEPAIPNDRSLELTFTAGAARGRLGRR